MNKAVFIALLLLCPLSLYAENFDPHSLIVKIEENTTIAKSPFITSSTHLFKQYFVLRTQNLNLLRNFLATQQNIVEIRKNYKSEKKEFPKATPAYPWQLKSIENAPFNDPYLNSQWSLRDARNNGMSVLAAYEKEKTQVQEVIVAVVDTGVDYEHEDLKDIMWKNQNEIPNNGIDDDQNGYVDDYFGINTLVRDSEGHATGNPIYSHGHGTHVSGIIAATQNNHIGVAGISSHARIMAIRTVPDSADETDANIVESFMYAAKMGAKLINCSFGKRQNEGGDIVAETIEHIGQEYGVLVIAAAGNDGQSIDSTPMYPASFNVNHLLVVASTKSNGGLSGFSNYGMTSVDLAAPGSGIYATYPANRYANLSGTSMATPNVVGVAAQVLALNPTLGPLDLKQLLMLSVTSVSSFSNLMQSGGRADLLKALDMAKSF